MRQSINEMKQTIFNLSWHWNNYHEYGLQCEKKAALDLAKKLARQLDDFYEQAKRVKIKQRKYPKSPTISLVNFPHDYDEEQELPF